MLSLVLADTKYKDEYLEFIEECKEDIAATGFDTVIPLSNAETVEADIRKLDDFRIGRGLPENWVPGSTYWLLDDSRRIIGIISIRHRLNKALEFRGGNISYYVRPSERGKGYGTQMLSLALDCCREFGMDKVLITCSKENTPSARVIKNNGGLLFSEDVDGMQIIQRYWIIL